jgi:predicted peptidase
MFELPREPGIHHLEISDLTSRVTLSLPPDIYKETTSTLVIALHYAGPLMPFFGSSLLKDLVEPGLRELGAIIAAPDCQAGAWDNESSEAQILELLDMLCGSYAIDKRSVLLTGYSIGGIGTWYIAGRNQGEFSAALPMAANPPPGVMEINWTLPTYVIHGLQDELFPIQASRDVVTELRGQGADITMVEVDPAGHFETGRFYRPLRVAVPWIRNCWSISE